MWLAGATRCPCRLLLAPQELCQAILSSMKTGQRLALSAETDAGSTVHRPVQRGAQHDDAGFIRLIPTAEAPPVHHARPKAFMTISAHRITGSMIRLHGDSPC